jgi:hypothetical protein
MLFETADADANCLIIALPDGGATDVPVLAIGDQGIINKDLTFFASVVQPMAAVIDDDGDSWIGITYSADDVAAIKSNRSIVIMPSGDTDDYLSFVTTSGRPGLIANGSYMVLGVDGTPGSATADGDVYIKQKLEVDNTAYFVDSVYVGKSFGYYLFFGPTTSARHGFSYVATDSNAACLWEKLDTTTNIVPVHVVLQTTSSSDLGLFDGLIQPLYVFLERRGQLHTMTDGIADSGAASAILKHTGGFTGSVVGDIVRMTAGTNVTTGWYWITEKTSANQVTLDRNFCTGDTTNATCVVYHNFPMIGGEGVCLKCFDGAPTDSDTQIDRDGWIQLDVGSNHLYHRSNTTWWAVQNAILTVEAVTTTNALASAESGSVFTNLGDADGANCTLPADAPAGTCFTFTVQAAVEFKIIIGKAAGKLYIGGTISTDDGGADLYVSADAAGETITLCCDGDNGWFATSIDGTWTVTQP